MYIHIPVLVFAVKVYPAHGSVLKALIIILTDYCSEVVGFLWITYYTNILCCITRKRFTAVINIILVVKTYHVLHVKLWVCAYTYYKHIHLYTYTYCIFINTHDQLFFLNCSDSGLARTSRRLLVGLGGQVQINEKDVIILSFLMDTSGSCLCVIRLMVAHLVRQSSIIYSLCKNKKFKDCTVVYVQACAYRQAVRYSLNFQIEELLTCQ